MSFPLRAILQIKGIMRPKRTFQKEMIRRQILISIPERIIPQSRTPDVERSIAIRVMGLALSLLQEVYTSFVGSEGKNDAYDWFRSDRCRNALAGDLVGE